MDKWEIARDRIVLKKCIGHGAFGAVWRARLSQPDGKLRNQTVAVKCFARKFRLIRVTLFMSLMQIFYSRCFCIYFAATSGEEGKKALMREIELGKLFGESEQQNIIKFIGCVTTEGK